jgi:hypothetical protein
MLLARGKPRDRDQASARRAAALATADELGMNSVTRTTRAIDPGGAA